MKESEEKLKSLLMKVKKESGEADKYQHSNKKYHGIQSQHFMANRRGRKGKKKKNDRFYFIWLENNCGW